MTTIELLARLRGLGIKLWAEGDRLRFQAPKGALTDELRVALAAHKADVLTFLHEAATATQAAPAPIAPTERGGKLLLSFSQQRLWFLDQLEPNSPLYNIPAAVRLSGRLDSAALRRSFDTIIERHESLRTSFTTVDQEPVQVIAPPMPVDLPLVDLRDLPHAEREAAVRRLATAEALTPFNLAQSPLLRVRLLQLEDSAYVVLFTMHHIISDGWSIGVLIRELALLYRAYTEGRPSPLPPLPVQYADFAVWQRGWLQGERLAQQLAYWQQQLQAAPAALDLPTDYPRPPVQTYQGATLPFRIPAARSQALLALSQAHGATLFMTLLAAFQTLLFRTSGQTDILVGSPIANRTRKEVEGLIGFFVNTLVLRSDLAGAPPFTTLLARVRQVALAAFAHQDLPFERLVEAVRPERDQSRSALFQVMLVLQNAPTGSLDLPGLRLQPLAVASGTAKFDLLLSVAEQPDGLACELEYNTALFAPASIARLIDQFQTLLAGILADPTRSITRLPLLAPAEQRQLAAWNATAAPLPPDPVHVLFAQQAARTPAALAVLAGETRLSYQQLDTQANQLAHLLRARGVGPDTPVGLCMQRSLELVVSILAVLKAGGAYLPLDPAYPPERLSLMLADAQAPLVLVAGGAAEQPPAVLAHLHQQAALLDLAVEAASIAEQPGTAPAVSVHLDALAYVIYTSGSTGRPKGVAMPQRPLVNLLAWQQRVLPGPARTLQFASPSFDVSFQELFSTWTTGGALVLVPDAVRRDPEALLAFIEATEIERLFVPFVALQQLAEAVALAGRAPGALRDVITAGEQLQITPALTAWFTAQPACRLHNHYGPSETHAVAAHTLAGPAAEWPALPPIGQPIANTQTYILDAELQLVPVGVVGELYLGGANLARGYLGRAGLTAERFVPSPFGAGARLYRTSDLARWRADGTLEFLGRADAQVKVRGYRIEPGEIESVLAQHPAVREVVVVARDDTPVGRQLVAYLVPVAAPASSAAEPGADPALPAALRSFLQARLPDYMLPTAFVTLPRWPLTPSGKIDRRALPAPDATQPALDAAYVAPSTPLEELLAALWASVLGVGRVGAHDNFFERGGHSLLATQLVSRVRENLQVDLPLRDLFAAPTVAGLAAIVQNLRTEVTGAPEATPPLRALERAEAPPLSFSQERLWFLDQLEPGSPSYNIPAAVRVEGQLDIAALQQSLQAIVGRHEMLRTTFALGEERPVQVIGPPTPLALPLVDLRHLPLAARTAHGRELAEREARTPFDLSCGPLLRVTVLQLDDAEYLVLFTMHHIIADGWSVGVILNELGQLYRAFAQGEAAPLPPLPLQYADFAIWQRAWLRGAERERQLAYWQAQLGTANPRGPVPLLDLPTDRPRPPAQTFRGATTLFTIPSGLSQSLNSLSQRAGATLFMTLLAAFQVLLARYSGQDDIAVGTPIANRTRKEIEPLIGCFINTLVLRSDLSGAPSFRELLGRVRQVTLGAYDHQDLPFELLVDALQPARQLSYNPLFQVLFVMQNTPTQALDLPDARLSMVELETGTAKVDLTLEIVPTSAGLAGSLSYNTDLFDQATIARLLGHYMVLLDAVVADPDQLISRLPLLSDAERQTFATWNMAALPYPRELGLHQLVEQQVARTPDHVALIDGPRRLTYRQLNARANQLAQRLRGLGVGPEVCVGICMERSAELIVGLLGILKAGGAYVPLDPAYPHERLAFMLADSRAGLLVTASDERRPLAASLQTVIAGHPAVVDLSADAAIAGCSDANPAPLATPANLAYLIYTSGSTGRPKGVAIAHQSAVAFLAWAHSTFSAGQLAGVLASTSICFDLSIFEIFAPLSAGGTVILAENALELPNLPAAAAVTLLNTVPSAMAALLRVGGLPPALRTVNLAGEPLPLALVQQIYATTGATQVYNLYGPSEDTTYSTYAQIEPAAALVPIGRPLPNTQAYLLDAQLQQVPIGVPGEVYLGGDGLARGYLHQPALTADRFVPSPFGQEEGGGAGGERLYRTGDLARFRPDGQLEYLGRIDYQVKVRGYRIELGEIEALLRSHANVRDVVVVAREDTPGDKRLVAYLVPDGATPAADPATLLPELRALLKRRLPEYMLPAAFVLLAALPLSPNGKIDRKALVAPDLAHPDPARAYLPPRTPLEELLAGLWSDLLGAEQIGVHDNFFERGGHSLLATQLVSRVRENLQVDLPLRDLFAAPTVAGMAELVEALRAQADAEQSAAPPPLRPVERAGPQPLSFSQERLWFLDQLEPGSPLYTMPSALRVSGSLDVAALEQSLNMIVGRHEMLRTTFVLIQGQPMQVIAPPAPLDLPHIDLRHLPLAEREARGRELADAEASAPFDLARGPLLRVTLLQLDDAEYLVLFTMHHIIADGWSIGVIVRELGQLYSALVGAAAPLPPLPLQYADFAIWQRAWLQGAVRERQLAYWQAQLGNANPRGPVPLLDLPTDRPRPPVQSFGGQTITFTLPQTLSTELVALSKREQTTTFITLLAAFQVLLARYSGQDDIAVGTPIANRTRKEIEPLIGCFINTLVLRSDLSGAPSFRELLGRVRQVTLGAYDHQDLPFELLVDALQPARQLSYNPLFQVLFVMQNTPAQAFDLPDLRLSPVELASNSAKTDLTLEIVPIGATLTGSFTYNSDLFDQATIERMLGHFLTLLAALVATPDRSIERLPLLTQAEQQLLARWNATAQPAPAPRSMAQLVAEQARRTPAAIALVANGQQLSYAELNARANQLAHHLRGLGVKPNTRVGICMQRSPELVIGLLGILKAGGAYVPLDPAYPHERLALMLADSRAAILVTASDGRTGAGAGLRELVDGQTAVVDLVADWPTIARSPSADPPEIGGIDQLMYIIFTSGSTGRPKAAGVTHRGFANLMRWFLGEFSIGPTDRVLLISSVSFDLTQKNIYAPLVVGGQLCLPSDDYYDPLALLQTLDAQAISLLNCTPSAFYPLADAAVQTGQAARLQLRCVFLGGEPIAPARLRRWWQARGAATAIVNTYGPTECTDIVAAYRVPLDLSTESAPPIGSPIPNTQLHILDAWLQPVPIGVAGELWVAGAGVGVGYLNDAALTAERFLPDPFAATATAGAGAGRLYRTGDLARWRADGTIDYLGRIDHQVKLHGFRIELGEIEAVLARHPAAREVVAMVREDRPGDKRLVAYVVPASEQAASSAGPEQGSTNGHAPSEQQTALADSFRAFLKDKLPDYMLPATFVLLAALPLSPNGKLDRKALPAPRWLDTTPGRLYVAPRTPLEQLLADLWAESLRVERVGIHDNFFSLGGNSIQGAVFVNRLQELLDEYVYVIALFESPTIAELASYLAAHFGPALARLDQAGGLAVSPNGAHPPGAAGQGDLNRIRPAPREAGLLLPLSFAQQRLWFLDQLDPGSPLYNIPIGMRISGPLDVTALRSSIDLIVARHESLRTSFMAVDGQPVQVIAPPAALPLEIMDLRATSSAEHEAITRELAVAEAQRSFDLERGPLVRATLVQFAAHEHLLLFTMHHIISDGWSMGVLIGELAASYSALVQRRPLQLPELPIQYADFAVWQRSWLQGAVVAEQLAYWEAQLRGAPAGLDLPTDRPRPPVQTYQGATIPFQLPAPLLQALQALSQGEGATLFMTLLAAFQTLLFRASGQTDILVGSPIANRTRKEVEGLIGFFVNTLVLRSDLAGNPSFRELLGRVRQVALGAFAHQDLPFEQLVEALRPARDLSRSPLFQVMLVLQNAPSGPLALPGLTLQPLTIDSGTAKFDLLLSVTEQPAGLACELEYNSALFDAATIDRLIGYFQTLLAGIVADPDQPIARLPLLTPAARQQLLRAASAPASAYPPLAAHQLVAQQAALTPAASAVIAGELQLSYQELDARANQLAQQLRASGVGPDSAVALCMARSPELLIGILGILKAGGAYVPLDPHYPAERLAFMLADAQAAIVLVAGPTPTLPIGTATVIDLVADWPQISRQPPTPPAVAVGLDDLAYVIYTSGSTGTPKGVAMPHRPLVNLIAWQQSVLPAAARTLQFASPSFDVSFQELFTTWASGGTLVLAPEAVRRDPEALLAFLEAAQIERLFMPFVALQQLAEAVAWTGRAPTALRDVITAGEQLQITPALAAWFTARPECRLHNHYGPTETHVVTAHTLAGPAAEWPALPPIGRPIANTAAYLLDGEGAPLPVGLVGELYLGGASLARGYLRRPALTAERFVVCPLGDEAGTRLYRTGDLARVRTDGSLEYLGRADAQVKVRGYRIELGEVEAVLAQHPAVREVAVVVRPDPQGAGQLVAYAVTNDARGGARPGADATTSAVADRAALAGELRAFLQAKLPDYMLPAAFVLLERWPLTPSGKIDRRALPTPDAAGLGARALVIAPRDSLELRLARIWEELLDIRPVGIRDNFFELGGHSLLVVRLMAQIQQQIGQKIPLATLFQEPTIEHLGRVLRQSVIAPAHTPLIALQPGGSRLPFFCVHPAAGSVLSYLELARLLGPEQPFYGLQAAGLDGEQAPQTTVDAMATAYLTALQAVQPEGPYQLGGWSFGGLVAYEIARRLTAQGHEVALLAMFDSWAPTTEPISSVDEATLLSWFVNDLSRMFGADLAITQAALEAIAPAQRLATVLAQARAANILPPDIDERAIGHYLATFTASLRAMQGYRPRPYSGRVTLFRAGDRPLDESGPTLGWEELASGGVALHVIPGDHYTIVRQPHVRTLAEQLGACLGAGQGIGVAPLLR